MPSSLSRSLGENICTYKHGVHGTLLVERAQIKHENLIVNFKHNNIRELFIFDIKPLRLSVASLGRRSKMP